MLRFGGGGGDGGKKGGEGRGGKGRSGDEEMKRRLHKNIPFHSYVL